MYLHRFTRWLTTIVTRLASQLRETFRVDDEPEPVTTTYSRAHAQPYPGASYLLPPPPNWLEDGRRLRPSLIVPPPAPRRPQPKDTPEAFDKFEKPDTTAKSRQPGHSRPAGLNGLAGQAPRVVPPQSPEPSRSAPPSQPFRVLPASSTGAADQQTPAADQLLHRRLMSLRHLVRLGVYNEGFAPERTPPQYHHSLGLGDIADSLEDDGSDA